MCCRRPPPELPFPVTGPSHFTQEAVLLLVVVFLFNRRLRVNLTLPGFEGSGILGFAASVIASPLDLIFMTALVMTTALPDNRGTSSLWLLVSESGGDPEPLEQLEFPIELNPDEEGLTEA